MDESQLATEVVNILSKIKHDSLLSDLVKVGVPSLVAIVSAVITYKISSNSSKVNIKLSELTKLHDEKMANLTMEYEKGKIINERRLNLIIEISDGLTNIIDEYEKYLQIISTKKHVESKNEVVSDYLNKEVINKYNSSGEISDRCFNKIYSLALMLSNERIASSLHELRDNLVSIHSECSFDCTLSHEEIFPYKNKLHGIRNTLFEALSNEFNSI